MQHAYSRLAPRWHSQQLFTMLQPKSPAPPRCRLRANLLSLLTSLSSVDGRRWLQRDLMLRGCVYAPPAEALAALAAAGYVSPGSHFDLTRLGHL